MIEYAGHPLSILRQFAEDKGLTIQYHPEHGAGFYAETRAVGWTPADRKEIARFIHEYEGPRHALPVEELQGLAALKGLAMEWDRIEGATFYRNGVEIGWTFGREQAREFIEWQE